MVIILDKNSNEHTPITNFYMSTVPSNESTHSDFLQLEQTAAQNKTVNHAAATEKCPEKHSEEHWDIDSELRALLEGIAPATPENGHVINTESQNLVQSITAAKNELTDIQRHNQVQVQAIERGVNQSQQLQQRTEQLAKYSKLQVRQMQELLQSFDGIRQTIVQSLDNFGHYEQLEPMLQKILAADLSLRQANEKLQAHQSGLYESLQAIQKQVEKRSNTAEQNLLQGQAEFEQLLETIRADRERTIALQTLVTQNSQEAQQLHNSLLGLQKGLSENAEQLQQNFMELAESVQHEKQQFYQLTADTINKTDAMRSQFAEMAKQVSKDWEAIQTLQFKFEDLRENVDGEGKQQVSQLHQRYEELVSTWSDVKKKQVNIEKFQQRQQTWIKLLSGGLGFAILLLIGTLVRFAR
jgi:DNA repair exonuclease SbcCD ATPase subunit